MRRLRHQRPKSPVGGGGGGAAAAAAGSEAEEEVIAAWSRLEGNRTAEEVAAATGSVACASGLGLVAVVEGGERGVGAAARRHQVVVAA